MAATDPTTRAAAARIAARARIAAMTDDERRVMTLAARHALRQHDLRHVDEEARRLGRYPLPDDVREFAANLRGAIRARKASDAAREARQQRAEALAELRRADRQPA